MKFLPIITIICTILGASMIAQTSNSEPKIQVIETKAGLTAWLVESHTIPMISVDVTFRAGGAFNPTEKQGLSSLTSSLLDEGAGNIDATTFQAEVEKIGAQISAGAGKLDISTHLTTLTEQKNDAFKLFTLALNQPRFDEEAVTRIKESMLAGIKRSEENPSSVASKEFNKALYGSHPYGNLTGGTAKTVASLTVEDIKKFHINNFTKNNMVISVVGDITPAELSILLDSTLSNLPTGAPRNAIEKAPTEPAPAMHKVEKDVPQASILFGHLAINREHPDYYAAYVMNDILGGGGFHSRFMDEVREKRGLAYGVYSYFEPLPHKGAYVAKVQTKNSDASTSIKVMKDEIKDIQNNGVSQQEYDDTISYLVGSFPLRMDSNSKILGYLTTMQMEDLGLNYIQEWPKKIKTVTKADVQRVAKELLHPNAVVTVIVGGKEAINAE